MNDISVSAIQVQVAVAVCRCCMWRGGMNDRLDKCLSVCVSVSVL